MTDARVDFRVFIRKKLHQISKYICIAIINFVISIALTSFSAFVCWLIYFRPFNLHPRVHSAALVAFDLAPAAGNDALILHYDLSLNLTFLNKRGWSTVHFDHLAAGLFYNGIKIGPCDDTLPSFKLDQEGGRIVQSVLRGQASAGAAVAEAFARESTQGKFNLNVRVKTTLSYWFFPHKGTYYYEYDCWLQFPPVPGDHATPAFAGGDFKCGVVK